MRTLILTLLLAAAAFSQAPPIEPGVSQSLAQWRAARYSNIRYKLNLTLEKMSPVLKGTIEIRVKVSEPPASAGGQFANTNSTPIILDWRKLPGHEKDSTVSNVFLNGKAASILTNWPPADAGGSDFNEHLIFRDGVVAGENVIKLDFTSPILPSGSAITRYVDKEDGSEYIYSLFVPSDASTAFPAFDQPDLKARFELGMIIPEGWKAVSNTNGKFAVCDGCDGDYVPGSPIYFFPETKPISTYVFAFAAGPWHSVPQYRTWDDKDVRYLDGDKRPEQPPKDGPGSVVDHIYVRKSQAEKFKAHSAEIFHLNREAVKYLETYFEYKFPWPKYDIVLIPEFPFGGMEHAGATFLKESSVIFPTEPTKGDYISRANLIFHETAHQWFGDTVTMKWFDDLWLKEGFAEFMAYKTLEKVMPEANAWKVFYERNKQAAYATDSTKGTTPIYQPIANLSAAKSAYGNIVYRKAPSFLRQAEFYLGEDKFQTAVRAFLKKHEFANAGWEDLVDEFESASGRDLKEWADFWVKHPGLAKIKFTQVDPRTPPRQFSGMITRVPDWLGKTEVEGLPPGAKTDLMKGMMLSLGSYRSSRTEMGWSLPDVTKPKGFDWIDYEQYFIFPNYGDYGYGIFLLDDKSRDYVLKNIQNEKDPFLRSMMWGALWDSVREAEMDPREYVELVIQQVGRPAVEKSRSAPRTRAERLAANLSNPETDETIVASILGRAATALNHYLPADGSPNSAGLRTRLEDVLIERMQNAQIKGQRITFYRAFLNIASSDKARQTLKDILAVKFVIQGVNCAGPECGQPPRPTPPPAPVPPPVNGREQDTPFQASVFARAIHLLKTKDKFDIVTRLMILRDPDAPRLLADLEKTETSDDAKRYAYAARAAEATIVNKLKFWVDLVNNKDLSESWIESAVIPFNSIRHADLTRGYLERALVQLPTLKRNRKIFFVNNWLAAWIGGQRDEAALNIVNKFLADNPNLDRDLRLKILENVDLIERAVKIRKKWNH